MSELSTYTLKTAQVPTGVQDKYRWLGIVQIFVQKKEEEILKSSNAKLHVLHIILDLTN